MLTIASIMTRDLVEISPDAPVDRALRRVRDREVRHALVLDRGRLVGILSERDLMEPASDAPGALRVRDRMSVPVETADPDEPVQVGCRRMLDRRIGCLPVLRGYRVVGILTENDLLRLYVRTCEHGGHEPGFDPPVVDVMSEAVVTVPPAASAASAWSLCRDERIRHLPVVFDGWLVGIVSDRDLREIVGRADAESRNVGDLMKKGFVAVPPAAPLSHAARSMSESRLHALPVLADGALRGIVTATDVLEMLCAVDGAVLSAAWTGRQALGAVCAEE